ncbi:hypothetical protein MJ579_10340 [Klebsiella pneumoniae]|nr:hypothetical protein MJ579_10340 [Klebsiella pneumoniae]
MWGLIVRLFSVRQGITWSGVKGYGHNILLLFFGQELKRTAQPDTRWSAADIFRVFHRVEQHFAVHDVHVQVLTTFDGRFVMEVTIHQTRQAV